MSDTDTVESAFFGEDYVETTLDPGWSLIVGTLIAIVFLHAALPCMTSVGSRRQRKRRGGDVPTDDDDDDEDTSDDDDEAAPNREADVNARDRSTKPLKQSSILLEKMESSSDVMQRTNRLSHGMTAIAEEEGDGDDDDYNQVAMHKSKEAVDLSSNKQLENAHGSAGDTVACTDDGAIEWLCGVIQSIDGAKIPLSRGHGSTLRRNRGLTAIASRSCLSSDMSRVSSSASQSVMSPLHHDDVSFTHAIDKYASPAVAQNTRKDVPDVDSGEVDLLWGERAWWKAKTIRSALQKLVAVSDIDDEMVCLLHIALPISAHGLVTGCFSLMDVSLIGYLAGAREASVFVLVSSLTWLPTTLAYGIFEALAKVVPDAIHRENRRLAGAYLTAAVLLFTLAMIPIGAFWSIMTRATFLRFGFDEITADLAQQYAYIQIFLEWISGMAYSMNLFLDLIGHGRFSWWSGLVFGCGQSAAVVLQTLLGTKNLMYIGLCRSLIASFHVLTSMSSAVWWGMLDGYSVGIASLSCFEKAVFKRMLRVAIPLGTLYFLNYGQWELLTLFVTALGPAEMVTWAILGYLWSTLKYLSDGIADAAESRVTLHLVLNEPQLARRCAAKSHFLGFFFSSFVTSVLFLLGMELSKGLSPNPTIQRLIIEILPLIGIGNLAQTTEIVSAAILGAQERSGFAIVVQIMGHWCVTMVLGSVFTFGFQIDLQGLASAVVLGLGLSSSGVAYLLLRSDWDVLAATFSYRILKDHPLEDEEAPVLTPVS